MSFKHIIGVRSILCYILNLLFFEQQRKPYCYYHHLLNYVKERRNKTEGSHHAFRDIPRGNKLSNPSSRDITTATTLGPAV